MIEKYVVSLDLAKKLKEAGYPQKGGGWYWYSSIENALWRLMFLDEFDGEFNQDIETFLKAPLAEEILEELPKMIYWKPAVGNLNITGYRLTIKKDTFETGCYHVGYKNIDRIVWAGNFRDNKLSNALARLWLWLKENGYLEERNED